MRENFKDCFRNPVRCLARGFAGAQSPRKLDYAFAWLFILAFTAAIALFTVILAR